MDSVAKKLSLLLFLNILDECDLREVGTCSVLRVLNFKGIIIFVRIHL